ncbi:DUF1488 domain-containing protein [Shewanella sp. GXUN23E]|uniref:DUF1488 domain-containing protein n=1 Tax=Shewanella sp. GXUN23E TaxID=3422498 RepID=UPI003D7C92D5
MNQSVIFPDLQSWDATKQQMVFPVQVDGQTLFCVIGLAGLAKLSGVSDVTAENVLDVFSQCRFDVEDLAELKLVAEAFDAEGHVLLG